MKIISSIEALEAQLATPSPALIKDVEALSGDIMILGLGGKMGPSLAKLALNAIQKGTTNKKIFGVSRFSNPSIKQKLTELGITLFAGDLLDESFLQSLPQVKNIIYLAGQKFGTQGNESYTWAMNTYLPGRVAEKFKNSRIVVFSSGNVYPFMPIEHKGATENIAPDPVGEYAQSCLGRERMFEHFSNKFETPVLIFRLNYALDLRYGIIHEVAKSIWNEQTIDLRMGYANVIWQGDANEYALRSLHRCTFPPTLLNVTGPEKISIRWLAEELGKIMDRKPIFIHEPAPTALLNHADKSHQWFGLPRTSLKQMIQWNADWVMNERETLDKPTHFQERKGKF